MYVLITYDVATSTVGGTRRLRRVAKACLDCGQRVQNSVFECKMDHSQFLTLRARLLSIIDLDSDSLRFYMMGNNWKNRIEHHGIKESVDIDGALIV
jgi:CRISPR-associated protein Cas2